MRGRAGAAVSSEWSAFTVKAIRGPHRVGGPRGLCCGRKKFARTSRIPTATTRAWYRDIPLLVPHVVLPVCPHLGLKILLVDKSEETGRFEIMPCTQYGAHPEFHGRYDKVLEAGDFPNGRRLNLLEGSGWVPGPRAFHRGTRNRSAHPRPELVIC